MKNICTLHRRYVGRRQPKRACPGCWWVWFYGGQQKPLSKRPLQEAYTMSRSVKK